MKIMIETIPHEEQRYQTVGDWYYEHDVENDVLRIRVSELGSQKMEQLVAVHELIEVILCQSAGVSQQSVDEFDTKYELDRKEGAHSEIDEPGDDLQAPYRKQHCFATAVERMMAAEMDVPWNDYAAKVESMP